MEQNENRFFKYIWRFNALAIAGAAVLCILLGSYLAIELFKNETRERRITNVVNVGDQAKLKEEFALGYPDILPGTEYVRIPLYLDQSYDMSHYSKSSSGNEVNFLFLKTSNNESRWLLEKTNQLFISDLILYDKFEAAPTGAAKASGIIYAMVERDTDGDGRLTDKDIITVSKSDVDGRNSENLIEGVERLYSVKQIADDKFMVLYQKNRETISELYSTPSMTQISQRKIPHVKLD